MKKVWSFILAVIMVSLLFAGCADNSSASPAGQDAGAASDEKIALVMDTVGVNPFLTQCVAAAERLAEERGFEYSIMECADASAWEENVNAAVHEGYTLIVGIGWQSAEYVGNAAVENPDKAKYAAIDTVVESNTVTSYDFNEVEGAYIMGVLVATAFPDSNKFGAVYAFQTQALYEYRWGYELGVRSVNPDAEFMMNYTNSYTDTNAPYEYALQQQAAGCTFIYACTAVGGTGIYQAAKELGEAGTPIYTNGQDVDETTPDNPYILASQLKNTGKVTADIIESFLAGTMTGGTVMLGVASSAIEITNGTVDAVYTNEEVITPQVREACAKAKEAIINGDINLTVPLENAA